jgi:hypothetical protein
MLVNMAAVGMLLNYSRSGMRSESQIQIVSSEDKYLELIERKKAKRAVYGNRI